jgi:hypothetical protein
MKISYSRKETKNLGNYESLSVEISMEDYISPEDLTAEEGFNRIRSFVLDKFKDEFNKPKITHDIVKNKVISFCCNDMEKKDCIEKVLQNYNASKIKELTDTQLIEFNNKLNQIIANYGK